MGFHWACCCWLVLLCALENDDDEMEMSSNTKKEIEMLRKKLMEWSSDPFVYQSFNWREPWWYGSVPYMDKLMLDSFNRSCDRMKSFDFSIDQPAILGNLKRCTYSELDGITNFENPLQKTSSGRLFRGIIVEGPKERSVIVKTWDFLLPSRSNTDECLNEFWDEIELFTDERANMHPNLVKLYGYCCDTRLALVFDEEFTGQVLWDVLSSDDFGWDERMKVVTQLADLFSCVHENKISFGFVNPHYIMIDKESNIKVFDHGYVTDVYKVDPKILDHPRAPEIIRGERTIKSDVYYFGVLLLGLIAKTQFSLCGGFLEAESSIDKEANTLVHECFTEVDGPTASDLTRLALCCTEFYPVKRPSMKDVMDSLNVMGMRGEKRKREENEAKQN